METQEQLFVLQHAEACASLPRGGKQSHLSRVLKFISTCPFSMALKPQLYTQQGRFYRGSEEGSASSKNSDEKIIGRTNLKQKVWDQNTLK